MNVRGIRIADVSKNHQLNEKMSGLTIRLHRAKAKLLGTAARDIAVPFEIACECGHRITGVRKTSSQQASCSACGSVRFVLPVNVYPSTRLVPSEVISGSFSARFLAATRELLPNSPSAPLESPEHRAGSRGDRVRQRIDETDPEENGRTTEHREAEDNVSSSVSARKTGGRAKWAEDSDTRRPQTDRPAERPVAQPSLPTLNVKRVARRTFTPFRLLMAGVLLAAGTTAWWTWNRSRLENARQSWRESMDLADTALRDGQLAELETALERAVSAASILQRADSEVQSVENLLIQTKAVNHLSAVDIVAELNSASERGGLLSQDRADTMESVLKTGWYFFDCRILVADEDRALVRLNLPLQVAGRAVDIEATSSLLTAAATSISGSSLLFVAKVESVSPPDANNDRWKITLDSESCALVTSAVHANDVGLDTSESSPVLQQLSQQQEFISVTDLFALQKTDQQRKAAEQKGKEQ